MADDADGNEVDPFGENPLANLPLFGDLSRALAGQGPLNWDAARQFAMLSASGGDMVPGTGAPAASPNIDPNVRITYAELATIAARHVGDVMGHEVPGVEPSVATPQQWAQQTLEAYRPLFTDMATSLGSTEEPTDDDPMAQMMAGLSKMMAPAMMGMAVGSMVGNLAKKAFGVYDLPIPRSTPALILVPPTIDAFASDWEIPLDEMRLWVLAHELAGATLFSVGHVADHLRSLVQRHVGAFQPDPSAVTDKLGGMNVDPEDPFSAMQQAFGDPEVLLGAVRSPEPPRRFVGAVPSRLPTICSSSVCWASDSAPSRRPGARRSPRVSSTGRVRTASASCSRTSRRFPLRPRSTRRASGSPA